MNDVEESEGIQRRVVQVRLFASERICKDSDAVPRPDHTV